MLQPGIFVFLSLDNSFLYLRLFLCLLFNINQTVYVCVFYSVCVVLFLFAKHRFQAVVVVVVGIILTTFTTTATFWTTNEIEREGNSLIRVNVVFSIVRKICC